MKTLKFQFFLFIGLFVLVACSFVQKNNAEKHHLHRKWMLVEYKGFTKEELTKQNAYIDLSKNSENKNQYGAKMGCNKMFFSAEFKDENLVKFSQIGSTLMYCDGKMQLEEAFSKDLPLMNQYEIEGHFLSLSNGNIKMKFVAEDWD